MKKDTIKKIALAASMVLFVVVVISNCSPTSQMSSEKSGAQLWGENCIRCHNVPSPETFSDVEWEVAVTHMRVRANLTSEESQKIVDFLKTAN